MPGANLDRQLSALKEAGIRISMDDFGMGHGSLNYLNLAYYDEVKIGGSLIKRLPDHMQTCGLVGIPAPWPLFITCFYIKYSYHVLLLY